MQRTRRNRAKISGSHERPRLAIFRSNRFLYAQLIDDDKGKTLVSASSREVKSGKSKTDTAILVGELIAKRAIDAKIKKVVPDRRSYQYHGRIKALIEGARKAGLQI